MNKTRKNYNVCKLYGVCEEPGFLSIVMRLYRTSLQRLVKQQGAPSDVMPRLPLRTLVKLGADIANGCRALHEAGVVVADLKPANVLLDEFDNGVVADFGMSVVVAEGGSVAPASVARGTPNYMSPESWNAEAEGLNKRSDVWSLGATILYMITGEPPFKGYSMTQMFAAVFARGEVPELPESVSVPAALRSLIERCFAYESKDRPSMEDCLNELNALLGELQDEPGLAHTSPPQSISTSVYGTTSDEEFTTGHVSDRTTMVSSDAEPRMRSGLLSPPRPGPSIEFPAPATSAPPATPGLPAKAAASGDAPLPSTLAPGEADDDDSPSIADLLARLEAVADDQQLREIMHRIAERCVCVLAIATASEEGLDRAATARIGLSKVTEALKVLLSAAPPGEAETLCQAAADVANALPPAALCSPDSAAPRGSANVTNRADAAVALRDAGIVPLLASHLGSEAPPAERVAAATALQRLAVLTCDDPIALLSSVPVHRVVPMVRKLSAASSKAAAAAAAAAAGGDGAQERTSEPPDSESMEQGSPGSPLSPTGALRLTIAARRSLLDDFEASRDIAASSSRVLGDDDAPFCASEAVMWLLESENVLMPAVMKLEFEDAWMRAM